MQALVMGVLLVILELVAVVTGLGLIGRFGGIVGLLLVEMGIHRSTSQG